MFVIEVVVLGEQRIEIVPDFLRSLHIAFLLLIDGKLANSCLKADSLPLVLLVLPLVVRLLAQVEDALALLLGGLLVDELAVGVRGRRVVQQLRAGVEFLAHLVDGRDVVQRGGVRCPR